MVILSIIVPVYNKEHFIDECIQSIISQSFTEFELILVNDGSTDQSGERCLHYAALDTRITVLEQQNMGVSAARNAGLAHAKGKYIGFVDSDDSIEQDMYETLIRNAEATGADISTCRLRIIKNGKSNDPANTGEIGILDHQQALSASIRGDFDSNANNKIYRSKILDKIRFEGILYEDILFACKAFISAEKTVAEDSIKYNYMIRDNSVSMSGFNRNYLETVAVSAKIVELVTKNDPECIAEAKAFDVMANISLLNLLILTRDRDHYEQEYKQVVNTLNGYKEFIRKSSAVRKKHKYAWLLFSGAPVCYRYCMWAYCWLTGADVLKRIQ
ncbi:glycosyltransferase [Pedobacter frigoris]|uniref:glycosyltransferase n=1 Tax=Pedobacter frigoris TaxID=2571272 RepID=UPI00292FE99F|nr:glycosyltransferase [Pedobacter frigoris]